MENKHKHSKEEKELLTNIFIFNIKVAGLTLGVTLGLALFIATNWLVLKGGDKVGPHLKLLGQYFIGYSVTFKGSILGFIYGFLVGSLCGVVMGWVYNKIAGHRKP